MSLTDRQIRRMLERMTRGAENDIASKYAGSLVNIRNLIAEQYRKYEEEGTLSFEIMNKYDRLDKLEQRIIKEINSMATSVRNDIHRQLRGQYQEAYYRTAYRLESQTRTRLAYSAVKPEVLDHAINNNFSGLKLNERLSRNRQELVIGMREDITRGLHQGQTYSQMTEAVQSRLEGDAVKARRIVRTEAHRVREEASYESVSHAEEQGIIMKKQWNTVADERVRDRHEELDGVQVGTDEEFEVDGYSAKYPGDFGEPEMDIHCRCFVTYEIVEIKKPQTNENVVEMSFEEWKSERLAA